MMKMDDGRWVKGSIDYVNSTSTYNVRLFDGTLEKNVRHSLLLILQTLPSKFKSNHKRENPHAIIKDLSDELKSILKDLSDELKADDFHENEVELKRGLNEGACNVCSESYLPDDFVYSCCESKTCFFTAHVCCFLTMPEVFPVEHKVFFREELLVLTKRNEETFFHCDVCRKFSDDQWSYATNEPDIRIHLSCAYDMQV